MQNKVKCEVCRDRKCDINSWKILEVSDVHPKNSKTKYY